MEKRFLKLFDYYPCIFSLITLLFCVPIFVKLSKIFNIVICIMGLLIFLLNYKKLKVRDFYLELILLFAVSLSICFAGNANLVDNIEKLVLCFLEVIILLHFHKFSNKFDENMKLIKLEVIGFSFIMSLISLILYWFGFHTYVCGFELGHIGKDLVGIYTHPNAAGIIAAFSIIFSIMLYKNYKENNKIRFFLVFNVCVQTLIIFLAHSNAPKVLIVLYLFLELIFAYMRKNRKRRTSLNSFVVFPNLYPIFEKLANGRFKLWEVCFKIIKDNFWFGVSPAGVSDAAKHYSNAIGSSYALQKGGFHNSYLQLFASVGFLGVVSSLALICTKLFNAIKYNLENSKYISICISILVYCLFESSLFFISAFVPIMFWICLGYINNRKENV